MHCFVLEYHFHALWQSGAVQQCIGAYSVRGLAFVAGRLPMLAILPWIVLFPSGSVKEFGIGCSGAANVGHKD